MVLDDLQQATKLCVGVKQTGKAVLKATAVKVFVAANADPRLTAELISLCETNRVEVVTAGTMNELGKACGIRVKAAAAAILKE